MAPSDFTDCLFCKIVAGEIPATACARTTARSPSWTSTRPRAATCSSSRASTPPTCSRSPHEDLAACAAAAQELARARQRERLGADGVNLLNSCGARRLADRLPLPRARDPALRGRPAAAAVDARRPATATRSRGGAVLAD